MNNPMTPSEPREDAVAVLPAKWRAQSSDIAKPYGFVTEHSLGKAQGLDQCADELEAALAQQGAEPVGYLAENANEAYVFFANDHESLDAYTADGFSITALVRGLTQAAEPPATGAPR